jgi:hypothetical protein
MIRLRCFQWVGLVIGLVAAALLHTTPTFAASCPTAVLFEPTAGGRADTGWNGVHHGLPLSGPSLFLGIDCGPSEPPCGTCTIAGVIPDPVLQPQRCLYDHSTACTPATELGDCGGYGECRTFLGPPEMVAGGGIGLCIMQSFASDVGGSVDAETGAFAPVIPLRVHVFHGNCARCVGDAVANDGVANGTCDAGLHAGHACDANATSPFSDYGSTSFDCSQEAIAADFTAGAIAASTGTTTRTLTSASPNCGGAAPGQKCLCQTCNSAAGEPCFTDADCPPSGGNPGICGGNRCIGGANDGAPCSTASPSTCPAGVCGRIGEPTKPDACIDDTTTPFDCVDLGGDHGECSQGPVVTFCANHPNRICTSDGECDGVSGACMVKNRPCFPGNGILGSSLTVSGTATPPVADVSEPTDLAVLSCVGSTGSAVLNNIGGYPGLVRSAQPGRLTFTDAVLPTPVPTATPPPTPTPAPTITPIPGACPAVPTTCRAPGGAKLHITDRSPDEKDRLQWQWSKGEATTVGDFGDPVATDLYALCLYDDAGLRATLEIPPGGLCRGRPCWRSKSTGFIYRNKDATAFGVTQITLKAGGAGRASLQLKGTGELLPLPALPSLTGTLDVQLRNQANGNCWGATFVPPFDKRTAEQLQDRAG